MRKAAKRKIYVYLRARLDTRVELKERPSLFTRASFSTSIFFPFFFAGQLRFARTTGVVNALWIRTSNAASRSEKKVAMRVLFRHRSKRCRDVGMTYPSLPFSLCFFFLTLSLSFSFTTSSFGTGFVDRRARRALTSPLSGLSYGRHYRRAHTLSFSIFVSPNSRSRARICAKGPLHLAHRSRTQPFFSIRDFITYASVFFFFSFFSLWSHERKRRLFRATFRSFLSLLFF